MGEYKLLSKIKSPNDVKRLNEDDIPKLCTEIREKLVETVSVNGGHLSPNLGVVELTVALHRSFNFPKDSIVWDVGHQSYTHKLLTGRYESFDTLRQKGGISGFPKRSESKYDDFNTGHSSTSISAAFGIANAKLLNGDNSHTIAVIGDGSFTGGLAFEAMNNAGRFNKNFIVVLNDNKMSISKNVGAFPRYLTTVRIQPWYIRVKKNTERLLSKIPLIGKPIKSFLRRGKSRIKNLVYKNTLFDCFGFTYLGPIDGHNVEELENAFAAAKKINAPVMIHVVTKKGKGYQPAEENPGEFHGIGQFDIDSGEPISSHKGFSSVFGKTMCDFAQQDKKICAITAAMSTGTGLSDFSKQYKERFFDVGIAEEHAVTFGCGLASRGMRPVFAVYSTFLQRSYDQLIHDIAMQNLKVVLAIDRAGFVGEDGESHQGIFDTAFINSVVGMTIFAPTYYDELEAMFYDGIYKTKGAVAIRYPRGSELFKPDGYCYDHKPYDIFGNESSRICIVTYGREFSNCAEALNELGDVMLIKLNKLKPIDLSVIDLIINCSSVLFFEEGIKSGGIGESFGDALLKSHFVGEYKHICVNDEFVKQAPVSRQMQKYGLDKESVIKEVQNAKGE